MTTYMEKEAFLEHMKDAPTIEAEPVKHGNWLWYCGAKLGGVEDGKK